MILEGKSETILLEEGEVQQSTKMEIDADSHIFLMRMLSKFYSDGIGSLIRETASNALDSHRACGVNMPIIVSLKETSGGQEFHVEDFGCGMDDKDVENIIKKYGKSTKRNSDTQLGAFGLGFKSPLAYTSSFYFIGRKDGIERKWMLYEADDESNKIDLLYESPTTEGNGVKIIVPIKWGNRDEFVRKTKQQLAYFESVFFDFGLYIRNENIKIVRSEHFQWSSLNNDPKMHICLDNVYYPIDYGKLGIDPINIPLGLRFSLKDGLFPIPNREQLKYTPEAKKIILDKIAQVSEYFVSKYNEGIKDTNDIFTLIEFYRNSTRYVPGFDGHNNIEITCLGKYSKIKFLEPTLKELKYMKPRKLYDLQDYLIKEYEVKHLLNNGRFVSLKEGHWRRTSIYLSHIHGGQVCIFTDLFPIKKQYLRETFNKRSVYYFVQKTNLLKLGSLKSRYTGRGYDNYIDLLGLRSFPKSEWRERIKEWQYLVSLVASKFVNIDKIEVPQTWLDDRKKKRLEKMVEKGTNVRRRKMEGEILAKVASPLERYVSDKNCKFVSENFPIKDMGRSPKFTIYGNSEQEPLIQKLYNIVKEDKIRLAILSDREIKNLNELKLHNWIEVSKFMKGKHRTFRRLVTSYLIEKLRREYPSVFNKNTTLKQVSTPLFEKVSNLEKYHNKYFNKQVGDEDIYEAMLTVAEEHKLFDNTIYDVYKEVKFILNRLTFIEPMFSRVGYSADPGFIKVIHDLFKYYKQRMDWQNYNLPINEEIEIKEELSETVLDEN